MENHLSKFSLLDDVILKKDLKYSEGDDEGILLAGTKGTIVYTYEKHPNAVMVEFFENQENEEGFIDTICIIDVYLSLLELEKKSNNKTI